MAPLKGRGSVTWWSGNVSGELASEILWEGPGPLPALWTGQKPGEWSYRHLLLSGGPLRTSPGNELGSKAHLTYHWLERLYFLSAMNIYAQSIMIDLIFFPRGFMEPLFASH